MGIIAGRGAVSVGSGLCPPPAREPWEPLADPRIVCASPVPDASAEANPTTETTSPVAISEASAVAIDPSWPLPWR